MTNRISVTIRVLDRLVKINLFILMNRDGQEIELSVKSADGKPRPVRLTPEYATWSYYWEPTQDGIGRLSGPTLWQ